MTVQINYDFVASNRNHTHVRGPIVDHFFSAVPGLNFNMHMIYS